ncbi:hypothetical protein [Nonomuraea dietziae]|uniref:hypothetical protein n=1 Tax=Nonomuraea dietziae TaxID=65515 RepID=UPI00336E9AA8
MSVETCDEALTAIARQGTASVQIIFTRLQAQAARAGAARRRRGGGGHHRPRAPGLGLLSGKYTKDTVFPADDHRTYNRHGESFDQGETFSGVDFATGVEAAVEFAALAPRAPHPRRRRCAGSSSSQA